MSIDAPSAVGTKPPDIDTAPEEVAIALPSVSLGDQLRHAPIVVAVSGEADGIGPVRAASALAYRYGSRVSAVQVLDVSDIPNPIPAALTFAPDPS